MKRIFTIITVLISLSLIGIVIQVSWIKNMVLLREEQIKHSVEESTKQVAEDLAEHKGSYAAGNNRRGLLSDDFSPDMFKPPTIGQRFSVDEIKEKFKQAFFQNNLKDIQFEFGIASFDKNGNNVYEKMTPNFIASREDTTNNFPYNRLLEEFSGTALGEPGRPGSVVCGDSQY